MKMIKMISEEIKGNICEAREKIGMAYKLREKIRPLLTGTKIWRRSIWRSILPDTRTSSGLSTMPK